ARASAERGAEAPPTPPMRIPPRAGAAVDAPEPPDAPPMVRLRVQIDGKGSVQVDGHGTCSSADPTHGNCMYDIPLGVAQHLQAVAISPDDTFASWNSITCGGQGASC